MKIKNLAFYGVMAAILGSVGTARADDSTIIASKGYVDAYAQKDADRVRATWTATSSDDRASTAKYPSMATLNDALTTVEGNIQSVNSNVLEAPVGDNTKLTQVSAIKATATNSVRDSSTAVNTLLPTEKAVADALALKEDLSNKQAAQVLGANETVTRWDTTAAEGTDAYTSDTMYPTVKAVAQQIAAVDVSAAVDHGTNALELTDSSTKAPSVTAVKGMTDSLTPVTVNNSTRVASVTNVGDDNHVFTTKAVASAFANLDGLNADGTAGISAGGNVDQSTIGQAVVKVTQTDGQVTAELGTINTQGIANGAVTRDKVNFVANQGTYAKGWNDNSVTTASDSTNNSNLGTGKATDASKDTYVPTMLAVEKYVADNTITPNTEITASTDHSIVTYDANGLVTDGISLPGLNSINSATTDAECTQGAPCVLSYYVNNGTKYYKWTNMDTEGLNAVNDSNS